MHGFADDEFVAALLAVDELVELADRGHLHFHEAARPFGRRLVGMRTGPTLARVGDILQLGEAIADLDHSISPGRACGMSCALSCARTWRVNARAVKPDCDVSCPGRATAQPARRSGTQEPHQAASMLRFATLALDP